MIHKILVPSGIGDFSWTWSKLSTTDDQYHIEYVGGIPDRMTAFLKLLPKDKILSFKPNNNYGTKWNDAGELVCVNYHPDKNPDIPKMQQYSDLKELGEIMFVESNTHLESGKRLEDWMSDDIPNTDFHYELKGKVDKYSKGGYFIVNFSSYGTKKAWGYYNVSEASNLVRGIVLQTGWTPIFLGGEYDDFTSDIYKSMVDDQVKTIGLVGRTPSMETVIALIQQSNLYFGACSGLMVLSNLLRVPVCTYYPPFETPPGRHLSGTWHDPVIPYMSLFWEGYMEDQRKISNFLDECR